jgi:hypothetical protein
VFRPNLHSRRAAVFVRNVTEGLDRPIGPIYIPGGLRCLFASPLIGGTKLTVLDRYSGAGER